MCNEGIANYHTLNSDDWNREQRNYPMEIKERSRRSDMCRLTVTIIRRHKIVILISFSSNQVQSEMCRLRRIFYMRHCGQLN